MYNVLVHREHIIHVLVISRLFFWQDNLITFLRHQSVLELFAIIPLNCNGCRTDPAAFGSFLLQVLAVSSPTFSFFSHLVFLASQL